MTHLSPYKHILCIKDKAGGKPSNSRNFAALELIPDH